jgi:predicted nucleic acid-binding protein
VVYVDTNILIYLYEYHPVYGRRVADELTSLGEEGQTLISSTLIITECLAGTNGVTLANLHSTANLQFIHLDEVVAEKAAGLQRETSLRIGDAIHLATALTQKADVLFTNDLLFAKTAVKYLPVKTLAAKP